jgi:hypothetical protein
MTIPINPNFDPEDLPVPLEEALEDETTPITISLRPTAPADEREQPVIDQKLDLRADQGYAFSIGVTFPDWSGSNSSDDQSISLPEQTDLLSQWLFDAATFLDQIESISHSKEPFATRVSRLKYEGSVPASLANRMQTLNNFRVQVVKERKVLDPTEWKLAAKYIDECRVCWDELTKK